MSTWIAFRIYRKVSYYSCTHAHMYGYMWCDVSMRAATEKKNMFVLQVWSSWDCYEHYFWNPSIVLESCSQFPSQHAQLHRAHIQLLISVEGGGMKIVHLCTYHPGKLLKLSDCNQVTLVLPLRDLEKWHRSMVICVYPTMKFEWPFRTKIRANTSIKRNNKKIFTISIALQ